MTGTTTTRGSTAGGSRRRHRLELHTRVAVTGSRGRLGRALVNALAGDGADVVEWPRPAYDLDQPDAAERVFAADEPKLVIHAAAWTDVDGCARDPDLALRRNATAVGELAQACARAGASLVVISTNEVFDGERTDGRGYSEDDPVGPINAYGVSKLAGEDAAHEAFAGTRTADAALWIVRTAWLYGPPGNDFPSKIIAAADRLPTGEALRVVDDETGSPTYTVDLARAILTLFDNAPPGTYHLAGQGLGTRYDVATAVVDRCRPGTPITPISRREFARASTPPAWAVLDSSLAASFGVHMRDWRAALTDYLDLVTTP